MVIWKVIIKFNWNDQSPRVRRVKAKASATFNDNTIDL